MNRWQEEPRSARHVGFKGVLAIGLDEAMTALEESLQNLEDRHNITTVFMHCLRHLDLHGCVYQGGGWTLNHEDRFDVNRHEPVGIRAKMVDLPPVADMDAFLHSVRCRIFEILEDTNEQDLRGTRDGIEWYAQSGRTVADAYVRTTMHTMAHVRQIWFLRGVLGLDSADGWPQQHWI
jgi:hypothetical protein